MLTSYGIDFEKMITIQPGIGKQYWNILFAKTGNRRLI